MTKNSNYLTHDLGARNDPKLVRLQMEMGGIGLAIYWIIIEMIWESDGFLPMDFPMIAYSIRWARSEDVESVVTRFDLFQNDGNRFWSRSALERINHKKEVSESRSRAGTKGAKVTNCRRAEESSFGEQKVVSGSSIVGEGTDKPTADAERFNGICSAIAEQMTGKSAAISKSNKQTELSNRSNISISERDKQRILEIFVFKKNFNSPEREMERFINHYEGRGWRYGDGVPVVSVEAAAQSWKNQENQTSGSRFHPGFLRWYQIVYASVEDVTVKRSMLTEVESVSFVGEVMTIRYTNAEIAQRVKQIVDEKKITSEWKLEYRVSN